LVSLGAVSAVSVKDLFTKCKNEVFETKKIVVILTEYVFDAETYCKRIVGSNRFKEVLVCCSVSERGHRLHYKNDSRREFTYSEYSKTLQLLSFDEYARDHDDDSTLETFVETEYFPIVACPIFGTSASGLFGAFTLCAEECRDTYPLTMGDCNPSRRARRRKRRGFDLVQSGVDAFLPEDDDDDDKEEEYKEKEEDKDEENNKESIWDVEVADLRPHRVRQLKRVAYELSSFLNQNRLYLKDSNAFAVGHSSELVGNKLMSILSEERDEDDDDGTHNYCSLLLIDRTLDLVAPVQHLSHVVDDALRRKKKPESLCHYASTSAQILLRQMFTQGSLNRNAERDGSSMLSSATSKIRRVLGKKKESNEDEEKEDLLLDSVDNLKSKRYVKQWTQRLEAISILQSLSSRDKNDDTISSELGMLENMQRELGCNTEDPLLQIADLLKRNVIPIRDILLHAVHTFSLFTSKQLRSSSMREIVSALSHAIFRNQKDTDMLESLGFVDAQLIVRLQRLKEEEKEESKKIQELVRETSERVVQRLVEIGDTRTQLSERLSSLQHSNMACGYRPLMSQIFNALLLDPSRPNLEDAKQVGSVMQHVTSEISNLVGAAWSTLGWGSSTSSSTPRATDHPVLIVFVLGGITAYEIEILETSVRKYYANSRSRGESPTYGPIRVIVGSTSLSSRVALYRQLFLEV